MKIMLSSIRQQLKVKAHALKPVILMGMKGLTPAVLQEIDIALTAHELIKIKLTGQDREARLLIKEQICTTLNAAFVQMIGMMLVIYRKNKD